MITLISVRYQVPMEANVRMDVLWDVASRSLVQMD
jgi:hypothetical protein